MASKAVATSSMVLFLNLLFLFTLVNSEYVANCPPPPPPPKPVPCPPPPPPPPPPKPVPCPPPPPPPPPPKPVPCPPPPPPPPPPKPIPCPPKAVPCPPPPFLKPKPTPPSGPNYKCPKDTLKFGVCEDALKGLLHLKVGIPPKTPCCSLIEGLDDFEAAVCLCTVIKANVLGNNLNVPVSLTLLLNYCGKGIPSGFQCS